MTEGTSLYGAGPLRLCDLDASLESFFFFFPFFLFSTKVKLETTPLLFLVRNSLECTFVPVTWLETKNHVS